MAQRGDGRSYVHTDGKSPNSTGLAPIGAAALPPPMKTKEKVEQGKETADHLMPLGYLLLLFLLLLLSLLFPVLKGRAAAASIDVNAPVLDAGTL